MDWLVPYIYSRNFIGRTILGYDRGIRGNRFDWRLFSFTKTTTMRKYLPYILLSIALIVVFSWIGYEFNRAWNEFLNAKNIYKY